jgi:plastocyanin
MPGYPEAGCIFAAFWETPVLMQPSGIGGTNWSPMPYNPDTSYFWDTGDINPGESKSVTFNELGNYYYICKPHPWMYGQVIVEQ